MTNPSINQNVYAANPEMKDLIDLLKQDIMLSLNCHAIGTIKSFNSSNQTAEATINYKKTFFNLDENAGTYLPVLKDYPILMDCPVILLGGGSTYLTFPIQKGDECLVLFNDRNLDNWFQSGGGGGVASPRLHAFADGIILVGLYNSTRSISNYDSNHAAIVNSAGAKVGVNKTAGTALIRGTSATLGQALQNFCISCESSSDGTLASAASALSSALTGILE